ncbi:298_t:CDS:2 [Cetraspora pellucida]|uniref:298_t:CDS:1 n=1 Tax=Cetraspora pellucida TaxID=1433469 RepID=A0ACA9LMF5_9GLOM|nr:298_t:CDS:2 [Cetraspora pellucida]
MEECVITPGRKVDLQSYDDLKYLVSGRMLEDSYIFPINNIP